ncbi:iron chelate uptake ABC transporter family permease subunit [Nocardioides zeae]|uniref:Iron chelate uptake ABC transporter family permease subunit n=1 Tax=Nocardioides imazamoxiresistens TaxID=3231893 RepID=A0ABU3PU42_9ACTN|nr:iron chelate uptake ABC transporter family permease subunit [Nocardioides zeae]MDT9592738.1 iron chelate uptake ABC transporter family permease subunit [Nocardioides zeae]
MTTLTPPTAGRSGDRSGGSGQDGPTSGAGTPGGRPRAVARALVSRVGLLGGLLLLLLGAGLASAAVGQFPIPPSEVLGSVLHRLGLDLGPLPTHPQAENSLWNVRFPRVVMTAVVGAALATAGALMQGVFGNPLAEPSVVGVSAGAAVAAAAVIVFSLDFLGPWTIAACAFAGGLVTTLLVYVMARDNGRTEVVTLVLTGIAINAVANAGLAFLLFLADTSSREEIVFWTLGSFNGSRWAEVQVALPIAAVGVGLSLLLARQLDLLALGDRAARHVGVDVERLRLVCIGLVALLTAVGVAFCGVIAFVGLVVPHLIRLVAGPGHRLLVPASALAGAALLVLADLWARTAITSADLPIGMLTSLIGGPFFFWLLRRARRTAGGWA